MGTMRRAACTGVLLFLFSCCSGLAGGVETHNVPASDSQLAEALSLYAQGLCFLDESHAPTGAATAVSFFRKAAAVDPASAEINEKLVETLVSLGDAPAALAAQLAFARHQPASAKAWRRVGNLAVKAKDAGAFAESIAAQRALPPAANLKAARRAQAMLDADEVIGWAELGRDDDALRAFERLVDAQAEALSAGDDRARRNAGAILVLLAAKRAADGSAGSLLAFADKLAAVVGDKAFAAGVYYELSAVLARGRGADPATVARLCERALLADPSRHEAVMGMVFPSPQTLRKLDNAAIAERIGGHPRPEALDYPFALMRLNYLLEAQDARAATAEYEKIKAMLAAGRDGAADSPVRHVLGSAALDLAGEREASVALLDEGLAAYPHSAMIKNSLAYTLALLERDLDRALDLVDAALKAEPDNYAYLDTLGWILYKKGDYAGALRSLISAVEREQDPSYEIYDHVGDVLVKLGRAAEAPAWWAKSYRITPVDSVADKLRKAGIDPASLRTP